MKSSMPDNCWSQIGVVAGADRSCERLKEVQHCRHCDVYHGAGRALLDRPLQDDTRAEWTRAVAETQRGGRSETRAAMVFRVADEWLAFPAVFCEEVTEFRAVHRLPQYPRGGVGLVNIHGRLEISVSLASLLGADAIAQPRSDEQDLRRVILVNRSGERFALPVAEVREAIRYSEEALEPVPATIDRNPRSLSRGLLHRGSERTIFLDPDRLFDALRECVA